MFDMRGWMLGLFVFFAVVGLPLVEAEVDQDDLDELKKYIFVTVDGHHQNLDRRLLDVETRMESASGDVSRETASQVLVSADGFFRKGALVVVGSFFSAYFLAAFVRSWIERRRDPVRGLSLSEQEVFFRRRYWEVKRKLDSSVKVKVDVKGGSVGS